MTISALSDWLKPTLGKNNAHMITTSLRHPRERDIYIDITDALNVALASFSRTLELFHR